MSEGPQQHLRSRIGPGTLLSTHSILRPSDAERWLRCVGAICLSKGIPSLDAEYNASGNCSHWLGEWALTHPTLDLDSWLGKEMTFGENPPFKFTVDEERVGRVRAYVEQIRREPGTVLVEQRLDTTPVLGVPGQEGHADTVILYPEGGVVKDERLLRGVLSVHDFKDGQILVRAKNNFQIMTYLCAAMVQYSMIGDYDAFRGCIHQPKLHHYDEWTWTREELTTFMDVLRPVAQVAYDLYYGNIPFDAAVHLTAGETQCQWCPVRGRCPERARYIISLFDPIISKHEINADTLAEILRIKDRVRSALDDYEDEANRRALGGVKIPGQKLIQGRRGARVWMNPEKAAQAMELTLGDAAYKPPQPISPTEAQNLLKDNYKAFAETVGVSQSPGRIHLAPEDDPHKEYVLSQFKPVPENS
jgi:Protein of unknown function (DUF2800)